MPDSPAQGLHHFSLHGKVMPFLFVFLILICIPFGYEYFSMKCLFMCFACFSVGFFLIFFIPGSSLGVHYLFRRTVLVIYRICNFFSSLPFCHLLCLWCICHANGFKNTYVVYLLWFYDLNFQSYKGLPYSKVSKEFTYVVFCDF